MPRNILAAVLLPALLAAGCVTTTTTTRTLGEAPQPSWTRYGRVETIREVVTRQDGNPAGGAVAGALVGGLLGSALGHHHYFLSPGTIIGAAGGAMVGAAASQGSAAQYRYEVTVRFDDGGLETFAYGPPLPFRVGDAVTQSPQGLSLSM